MIGLVIAVVVIAALFYRMLRSARTSGLLFHDPWRDGSIGSFSGIPIITSPYVPKGTMLVFSPDLMPAFDLSRVTVGRELTHHQMWDYLSRPITLDPKSIVRITLSP